MPGYSVENWTKHVEDLLLQAGNQDNPELWRGADRPPAPVRRAAGSNPNTETAGGSQKMGGFFEHYSRTIRVSEALERLGYEFLGGSEIGEHALDFQRRVLGLSDTRPVDFWSDPVGQLTIEETRRLVLLLVAGLPYTEFLQVNALMKGTTDRSAWMAVEVLKTLDDPDIKL